MPKIRALTTLRRHPVGESMAGPAYEGDVFEIDKEDGEALVSSGVAAWVPEPAPIVAKAGSDEPAPRSRRS